MKTRTFERSMFYNASPVIFQKAEMLRKNQLGVRFKAQHPIEHFIADFYSHKAKLVVEVDGEIHNFQKEYDLGREAELEKYGIKIIRFTNKEIFDNVDNVIEKIKLHV